MTAYLAYSYSTGLTKEEQIKIDEKNLVRVSSLPTKRPAWYAGESRSTICI